jgi:16S rRNA G527 N7-methylase RsmG
MQTNALSPAYPIAPMQDSFGRMVVPVAGLSKLEYFALEIYKSNKSFNLEHSNTTLMELAILDAITLLNKIEQTHKTLSNEKDSVLDIIQ